MRERLASVTTTTQIESGQKPQELTLRESLVDKELAPEEERAVWAIDVLKISIGDKQILFAAKLFFGSGGVIRAREQFGFSIDKTVGAKDRVRTNQRYEGLWQTLEILLRPNFVEVAMRQDGMSHKEIAKELKIPLKRVAKIDRALVFLKLIPPTKSGEAVVEKQDIFMRKVAELRLQGLGNPEVASILKVPIGKVESATRFLIWLGMIKPFSKSEALKTRWNRKFHKEEVKTYLDSLDSHTRINIRRAHRESKIPIGYDMFLSLYHELAGEQKVPPAKHLLQRAKNKIT